jgi:hypothetical protein
MTNEASREIAGYTIPLKTAENTENLPWNPQHSFTLKQSKSISQQLHQPPQPQAHSTLPPNHELIFKTFISSSVVYTHQM